jgi:AdoMet-dependent rRNA methyltransferase SPB1
LATANFQNPLKEAELARGSAAGEGAGKRKDGGFLDLEDADDDIFLGDGSKDNGASSSKQKKYKIMNDDEDWTSDEENKYKLNTGTSDMERRRKALKRSKRKLERKELEQAKEDDFEVVPEKTLDDFDVDDLSHTLALAKKMLRKKEREDIIESTYSRYANDDHDVLPSWFVEDEKKHNFLLTPVTKQDIIAEKERIMSLHSKTPKKVQFSDNYLGLDIF